MANPFPASCAKLFHPVRPLASGGFGTVWLATQVALNRLVVVKVLHAEMLAHPDQVKRFNAEAQVASRLRHPNIVQLIDHGVDGSIPWITYEYVEGSSLRATVEAGPMPWQDACAAVAQVAAALEEAHAHAVLHRDVKPDNVLVAGPGHYKLTDFGIARWHGSGVETAAGIIMGSPAYLSPNQIQGLAPGFESDVYALGTMFFELLTGRLPFWDENLLALFQQRLTSDVPAPSRVNPLVPPAIDEVVHRAMARDRDARYRTARELREAIDRLLQRIAPTTTTQRATGTGSRPDVQRSLSGRANSGSAPRSRSGVRWKLAAGVLAILTAALGWRAASWPRPSPAPGATSSSGPSRPGATRSEVGQFVFKRYVTLANTIRVRHDNRSFSAPELRALQSAAAELIDSARALRSGGHESLAWIDLLWFARQWSEWVASGPRPLQPELKIYVKAMAAEAREAGGGPLRSAFASSLPDVLSSILGPVEGLPKLRTGETYPTLLESLRDVPEAEAIDAGCLRVLFAVDLAIRGQGNLGWLADLKVSHPAKQPQLELAVREVEGLLSALERRQSMSVEPWRELLGLIAGVALSKLVVQQGLEKPARMHDLVDRIQRIGVRLAPCEPFTTALGSQLRAYEQKARDAGQDGLARQQAGARAFEIWSGLRAVLRKREPEPPYAPQQAEALRSAGQELERLIGQMRRSNHDSIAWLDVLLITAIWSRYAEQAQAEVLAQLQSRAVGIRGAANPPSTALFHECFRSALSAVLPRKDFKEFPLASGPESREQAFQAVLNALTSAQLAADDPDFLVHRAIYATQISGMEHALYRRLPVVAGENEPLKGALKFGLPACEALLAIEAPRGEGACGSWLYVTGLIACTRSATDLLDNPGDIHLRRAVAMVSQIKHRSAAAEGCGFLAEDLEASLLRFKGRIRPPAPGSESTERTREPTGTRSR